MKNHFLVSFFLLFLSAISAQEALLRGRVTDADKTPLEGITIAVKENAAYKTSTDGKGKYELKIPAGKEYTVIFLGTNFKTQSYSVTLAANEDAVLNVKLISTLIELKGTEIKATNDKTKQDITNVQIKVENQLVNPSGGIELYLRQALGVSGNNELSSTYSVRGGSFDENLVYVNDFEVYRPYLVRSGQQEGLSFANPNLVSNIKFSSGGFQAKYGDKLSSVLDVTYKRPNKWAGSAELSLLGGQGHIEGTDKTRRFTFLAGVRQRSAKYLFNSLPQKGQYSPSFTDFQTYLTFQPNDKWLFELLGNYAQNSFRFLPTTSETDFGLVNYALRFKVDYQGSENDRYRTFMTGLGINYFIKENVRIRWQSSIYRTRENEAYDIIGDYQLGEKETDPAKQNYNGIKSLIGAGLFHNSARNELNTLVFQTGITGSAVKGNHATKWGFFYKIENIKDELNEWVRADSSGYSVPYSPTSIQFKSVLKSTASIQNNRFDGYVQNTWRKSYDSSYTIGATYGLRYNYNYLNNELFFSPRVQLFLAPKNKKWLYSISSGIYIQPTFYREMRDRTGVMHLNTKAQKSAHIVAGADYNFKAWDRPFKFTSEAYYKYMWDIIPYEYNNVLIRYNPTAITTAYATGVDFRLQGELVKDAESWITLSLLNTKEKDNGTYYDYRDDTGGVFISKAYTDRPIIDSISVHRGMVRRPTDQLLNLNVLFQDYIPKHPNIRVHLNLIYGTGLPFGPPNNDRYRNTFTMPSYKRVDAGFSASFFDAARRAEKLGTKKNTIVKSIWFSLEVYNLLGINNTVSYQWIKDYANREYAVPNYLTSRRLNARLVVKF